MKPGKLAMRLSCWSAIEPESSSPKMTLGLAYTEAFKGNSAMSVACTWACASIKPTAAALAKNWARAFMGRYSGNDVKGLLLGG